MRRSRTTGRVAIAMATAALVTVSTTACDLVDEGGDDGSRPATVQRRFDGRTLLVLQPAGPGEEAGGTCRPAQAVACSLDLTTSYELLGGPSRVSLVNAKVVQADDGSWGVQARFTRESEETVTLARQRAATDGTALLLVGNGNRVLLDVPTGGDGRLVVTAGGTEADALAVVAALSDGG